MPSMLKQYDRPKNTQGLDLALSILIILPAIVIVLIYFPWESKVNPIKMIITYPA